MSSERDETLLCVVESPADVMAIEQSGSFRGKYHVLGGHLSPLDGIGPEEVGIPFLIQRLAQGPQKSSLNRLFDKMFVILNIFIYLCIQ